ncbi:hypothetical protein CCACVL1_04478 [Corchorus capsularis]|uniref:Uncharacterized protein n=1 Tax=Corchorus capsularis TaxID=210143 RepID=A0A1R3JS86_COCAP|nr:hypothetical protein CCACVL1_04478 [Corchorus capsularis]
MSIGTNLQNSPEITTASRNAVKQGNDRTKGESR